MMNHSSICVLLGKTRQYFGCCVCFGLLKQMVKSKWSLRMRFRMSLGMKMGTIFVYMQLQEVELLLGRICPPPLPSSNLESTKSAALAARAALMTTASN